MLKSVKLHFPLNTKLLDFLKVHSFIMGFIDVSDMELHSVRQFKFKNQICFMKTKSTSNVVKIWYCKTFE